MSCKDLNLFKESLSIVYSPALTKGPFSWAQQRCWYLSQNFHSLCWIVHWNSESGGVYNACMFIFSSAALLFTQTGTLVAWTLAAVSWTYNGCSPQGHSLTGMLLSAGQVSAVRFWWVWWSCRKCCVPLLEVMYHSDMQKFPQCVLLIFNIIMGHFVEGLNQLMCSFPSTTLSM